MAGLDSCNVFDTGTKHHVHLHVECERIVEGAEEEQVWHAFIREVRATGAQSTVGSRRSVWEPTRRSRGEGQFSLGLEDWVRYKSFSDTVRIIDMEAVTIVWDCDEGGLAVKN